MSVKFKLIMQGGPMNGRMIEWRHVPTHFIFPEHRDLAVLGIREQENTLFRGRFWVNGKVHYRLVKEGGPLVNSAYYDYDEEASFSGYWLPGGDA